MQFDLNRGDIVVIEAALSMFSLMMDDETPEAIQVNDTLSKFQYVRLRRQED